MDRLRNLVREIHRRSLWQVLGVYAVGAWVVIEVVQTLTEALGLPSWFPPLAVVLIIIGLPIVMATAFVQEGGSGGEAPAAGGEPSPIPAAAEPPGAFPTRLLTWRNAIGGGVLAFAMWGVVAAGWVLFGGAAGNEPADDRLSRTIAVLPFDNLSPDPENEYFAGGIHEEILTNLARISDLTVISRTSVLPYRDSEKSLREIARELGAGVVLEGSVQKADGRVRITTQLVDARTDGHLWAERYDRRLDDVFAVQTDIARRIADELRATILPEEEERIARAPTAVPEAHEAYLRGLDDLGESQREEPIRRALEAFRRAVELDPAFAAAHARLAWSHMELFWYGYDRTPERLDRAREAAERALALDPDLLESRLAVGRTLYTLQDFDGAFEHLAPLADEYPNSADAVYNAAAVHRRRGEWERALSLFERAVELDPLSGDRTFNLAGTYAALRRYEEAEPTLRRAVALAPEQGLGPYGYLAVVRFCRTGRPEEARRVLEDAPLAVREGPYPYYLALFQEPDAPEESLALVREIPDPVVADQGLVTPRALLEALFLDALGRRGEAEALADSARRLLEPMAAERPDDPRIFPSLGRAYALLGRTEEAARAGERGVELVENDAFFRPAGLLDLAGILALAGERDRSVSVLEEVWELPGAYCRDVFAQDPAFRRLQGHPGFEALLEREMRRF